MAGRTACAPTSVTTTPSLFSLPGESCDRTVTEEPKKESFVRKHLDPASRLGEILFGLIMVLTATLTAGLTVAEGKAGVRQLLLSALGCNIAWGIIDAIMYIMNCITKRSGQVQLLEKIRSAPDSQTALDLIRDEVEPEFQSLTAPEDREALYRSILKHATQGESARRRMLTKEDLYGALACFWLVFISRSPQRSTLPSSNQCQWFLHSIRNGTASVPY